MKKQPKLRFTFELEFKQDGEKMQLTISPAGESGEFKPLITEVSKEFFDTLRFHFATAVNDANGITKICVIA